MSSADGGLPYKWRLLWVLTRRNHVVVFLSRVEALKPSSRYPFLLPGTNRPFPQTPGEMEPWNFSVGVPPASTRQRQNMAASQLALPGAGPQGWLQLAPAGGGWALSRIRPRGRHAFVSCGEWEKLLSDYELMSRGGWILDRWDGRTRVSLDTRARGDAGFILF